MLTNQITHWGTLDFFFFEVELYLTYNTNFDFLQ